MKQAKWILLGVALAVIAAMVFLNQWLSGFAR